MRSNTLTRVSNNPGAVHILLPGAFGRVPADAPHRQKGPHPNASIQRGGRNALSRGVSTIKKAGLGMGPLSARAKRAGTPGGTHNRRR